MKKYKVGDKIKVVKIMTRNGGNHTQYQKYVGETGVITANDCYGDYPYHISVDGGEYYWRNEELEPAGKIKVTQKSTEYKISEGNISITATKDVNGKITLYTRDDNNEFVFINSNPELIKKIAKLIERASEL